MGVDIDKYDRIIACSSGVLMGALDVLWVGDLSLFEAHKWGTEETNKFVYKVAKHRGFKGKEDNIAGAIDFLEEDAPIWADKTTNSFGGGYQHHLRDFSHHPTPVGLIFSLLNEFTGYGFGTDTNGKFITVKIDGWHRKGLLESIYSGTVKWTLHMISDVAGSSSSVRNNREGTGIPGPFMSMLKELSSIPGLRSINGVDEKGRNNFSVGCSKLFNGTLLAEHDEDGNIIKESVVKFDLRTELGLAHETIRTKQYVPVLINEAIVCAFYSVRRLLDEIKRKNISSLSELQNLDFSKFLPWNSNELRRMRTISALSFSTVDMSMAAVKAYGECGGDKVKFAVGFAKRVNYFGVGRLIIAGTGEVGMKLDKSYDEYKPVVERLSNQVSSMKQNVEGVSTLTAVASIGTPLGFVSASIGVYKIIKSSADEYNLAKEERERIQRECEANVLLLQDYRTEMEEIVSEYMIDRLTVFGAGLDMMDQALLSDNTDDFIKGNNMIQEKLGNDTLFSSQDEFDALMNSDDDFKL